MYHDDAKKFLNWLFKNNADESYMQQVFEVLQVLYDKQLLDKSFFGLNLQNILAAKEPLSLLKALLLPDSKLVLDNALHGRVFLELAVSSNAPLEFISELTALYHLGGFASDNINHFLKYFLTAKSDVSSVSEALCFVYDSKLFFEPIFWTQFGKLEFPHLWSKYTNCLLLNFNLNAEEVILYSRFLMYTQHHDIQELYFILLDIKEQEKLFDNQKSTLLNLLFQASDNIKNFYSCLKMLAKHQIYPNDLESLDLSGLDSSNRLECTNALIALKNHGLNQPMFQSIVLQCQHFSKINYRQMFYHHMTSCLLVFKNMGILDAIEQLKITEFISYKLNFHSKIMQDLLNLTQSELLFRQVIQNQEYSLGFLDCALTLLKPILEQKLAKSKTHDASISN